MDLVTPGIGLIFWMTLVFALLLFILKKFAWIPILRALKSREQNISDSLDLARKTRDDMNKLQANNEALLIEARTQRENIITEANKLKSEIINDAKAKAQSEANRLVEEALISIENERRSALKEIKTQVAELSIQIAEKVISAELSDKEKQSKIVEKQIENLNLN